jgi:aldose 1-epimerase
MRRGIGLVVAVMAMWACTAQQGNMKTASGLVQRKFQTEIDGKSTDLFRLTNTSGMEVCVTNYGGRIVSILVPDRKGIMRDVVLGFDNIAAYQKYSSNYGATIGRYANRIAKGRFVLDGDTIQLDLNDKLGNNMHGGKPGWAYRVFDAVQKDPATLVLTYVSPDGESHFPGTVQVEVAYHLTDDNALDIAYTAVTDRPTVINMTNHSFFNLSGKPSTAITDHIMWMAADSVMTIDSTVVPTGNFMAVQGTPFDFSEAKSIGQAIDSVENDQIRYGLGYNHNWVLRSGDRDKPVASLYSPVSGILLEILTDEPCMQIYTGNYQDGTHIGKKRVAYPYRGAICLEPQHAPDSPNHPTWPSVRLDPGQLYTSHSQYRFSVAD